LSLSCGFATPFDAVTGFSLVTNTATNTWSYYGGSSTNVNTFASTVSLLPVLFNTTCGSGTSCWDATGSISNLILQNVTGATATFPNSGALNNQLTYYTRSGIVDVRFLVPTTGTYSLTGFFEGSATAPESSQEFIAIDGNVGSPLFNMTGAVALGATHTFSVGSLSLHAGDTVDFLVAGISTTADLNSISTGFDATFTQGSTSSVPEPGTLALLAGGLLVLGYKGRRSLQKRR
jgi:PEP-CTERM motif